MKMKLHIKKILEDCKPFLSNKTISLQRIVLNENERVIYGEEEIADTLNTFLSNLQTSKFRYCDP